MSLYTLDGTTRKLLKLDRFDEPNFSVKSFIEQLTGSHQHLDDGKRLDPKPYIRTLESASNELQRLYEVAFNQEEIAGAAASDLNESRNDQTLELNSSVQDCVDEVKSLDEIATEIQQSNGNLGHKLKNLSSHHAQIQGYRLLVSAYLSFKNSKPPTELSRLWSSDRRSGALFVSKLQKFANLIGGDGDVETRIDKYAESLENELVAEFQEKYQNFDLPGMRECSEVSTGFNGGGAIIQAYINQHPFFMNLNQLQSDEIKEESKELWDELGDPEREPQQLEMALEELFRGITDEITKETEIITKVFTNPARVLSMFIQRTFVQRVQSIISGYMEKAMTKSPTLIHIRVLSACYTKINTMNNNLQNSWSHENSGLSDKERSELGHVLELNFADVVLPYTQDYFDLELQSLNEIINYYLQSVNIRGVTFEDGKMDRLKRAMQYLRSDDNDVTAETRSEHSEASSPSLTPITSSSVRTPGGALLNPTAASGCGGSSSSNGGYGNSHSFDSDGTASSDVTNMIRGIQIVLAAFAEAISREQILRTSEHFIHDATKLFNLLMIEIGGRCISSVIDSANETANKVDAKQVVKWEFMLSVKICSHSLRLVSCFVRTALFAMVQYTAVNSQTEMAEALNTYVTNVQNSCKSLIERCVSIMHMRTAYLFGKQNKRDFIEPANNENIISSDLFNEISQLFESASANLSASNLRRLCRAVARNFCKDLHAHIMRYTISVSGGKVLSNDILKFERLMVNEWSCGTETTEDFTILRSIVRLYVANPSLLPSLLRDSHLSKIPPSQLRGYLAQRVDYNPKTMQMLFFNNNPRYLYNY